MPKLRIFGGCARRDELRSALFEAVTKGLSKVNLNAGNMTLKSRVLGERLKYMIHRKKAVSHSEGCRSLIVDETDQSAFGVCCFVDITETE